MSFSQRPLRGLAIVLSLGMIIGSAGSTIILARSVNNQIDDILATYKVREQAYGSLSLMTEAHNSQRGFILTNSTPLLDHYRNVTARLDESLNTLTEMTKGNPRQQATATRIRDLAKAKQRNVDAAIAQAVAGMSMEARESLGPNFGVGQLDEINKTVDGFLAEEDRRLIERNIAVDQMRSWLTIAALSSLGGALILAVILANRTRRYVRKLTEGQTLLLSEKTILESMVQNRTAELEKAMLLAKRERARVETLLQDSDHRIGNSLATVSSLLGIQMRDVSSEEIRAALGAARDRIQTISSAHRRLRLGKDHETVRADEYLPDVIADIKQSTAHERDIRIVAELAPINLSSRDATTLGIIIGELTMNAIKHAFPGSKAGEIRIDLVRGEDDVLRLEIADTGIGMQKTSKKRSSGLGSLIVNQLCQQFDGSVVYSVHPGGGTSVKVALPGLMEIQSEEATQKDE
ncbi:sensor histidine kinase [Phyllobacterium chamaecytisi]|uniref:sensor histidine kinase n=1 Tax=Phyllobacterium chamaecytisi TaxID=2876082 RepID=UPI001CCA2599|nr:CHASE3 domain-containing protein [Phyllobacterium sp. KW56]MBZ9602050.1 CHASE3 domain-containing protein [Phyllobacterium sp. KW56]